MTYADDWEPCQLGDMITLKRGYDLPERDRRHGQVPIVTSAGVTGHHSEWKVRAPGVVTGRYGTLGQVFYIDRDFWPHNTSLYVQDFKGNDPRFIAYFLRTLNLGSQDGAAAVPGVNRNFLHMLKVRKPPLPIQRKIAAILSAYDELIENNTRRIAILEEMARALYREWFVDFRFPGHEQTHMIETSVSNVPAEWKLTTLNEACASIADGDWIETKDQGGSDYRLLQVSNIGVGSFVETGNYRSITQGTFERLRCQEVVPGDILISRMPKPIGRAWLVTPMPWRMVTAVDVAIAKPHPERSTALFLSYYLNSHEHIDMAEKQAGGTTRARISRSSLCAIKLLLPTLSVQKRFSETILPLYELGVIMRHKNDNLRQTRDMLLPKLISGEVDISELELAV